MLSKTYSIGISSQLHSSDLKPRPLGIQLRGSDECEVHTQVTVDWGAINANEDTKRNRRPRRILRSTIETCLSKNYEKLVS